jgi:hypothetical protein
MADDRLKQLEAENAALREALQGLVNDWDSVQPMKAPNEEQIARLHKAADFARGKLRGGQ